MYKQRLQELRKKKDYGMLLSKETKPVNNKKKQEDDFAVLRKKSL